jgi:prepilin-type processing-associated H-X9-DG protein
VRARKPAQFTSISRCLHSGIGDAKESVNTGFEAGKLMKMERNKAGSRALSLNEVLIVLTLIGVVGLVILPMLAKPKPKAKGHPKSCVNDLKQIGLAFRIYANDNNDLYPMQVAEAEGGTKEAVERGELFRIFLVMSNELSVPRTVICPADQRSAATNWATLANTNLSYFVGLDAEDIRPNMILSGDRDIAENGQLLRGTANLTTNRPVAWHKLLHKEGGNVALADGSVQQTTVATLRQLLANTGDTTNRVLFPQ